MKSWKVLGMIFLGVFCNAGSPLAEEAPQGWSMTVAAEFYNSTWIPDYQDFNIVGAESAPLINKYLSARYNNLILTYGFFSSSNTPAFSNVNNRYSGNRTESEFSVSYMATPSLKLMVGKKKLTHDFLLASGTGTSTKFEWDVSELGATYFFPLGETKLVGFGNLALGSEITGTNCTITPAAGTRGPDVGYVLYEPGLIYSFTDKIRVSTSYRIQYSSVGARNKPNEDNSKGLVLGASYTF